MLRCPNRHVNSAAAPRLGRAARAARGRVESQISTGGIRTLGFTEENFGGKILLSFAVLRAEALSQLRYAEQTNTNNHEPHQRNLRWFRWSLPLTVPTFLAAALVIRQRALICYHRAPERVTKSQLFERYVLPDRDAKRHASVVHFPNIVNVTCVVPDVLLYRGLVGERKECNPNKRFLYI